MLEYGIDESSFESWPCCSTPANASLSSCCSRYSCCYYENYHCCCCCCCCCTTASTAGLAAPAPAGAPEPQPQQPPQQQKLGLHQNRFRRKRQKAKRTALEHLDLGGFQFVPAARRRHPAASKSKQQRNKNRKSQSSLTTAETLEEEEPSSNSSDNSSNSDDEELSSSAGRRPPARVETQKFAPARGKRVPKPSAKRRAQEHPDDSTANKQKNKKLTKKQKLEQTKKDKAAAKEHSKRRSGKSSRSGSTSLVSLSIASQSKSTLPSHVQPYDVLLDRNQRSLLRRPNEPHVGNNIYEDVCRHHLLAYQHASHALKPAVVDHIVRRCQDLNPGMRFLVPQPQSQPQQEDGNDENYDYVEATHKTVQDVTFRLLRAEQAVQDNIADEHRAYKRAPPPPRPSNNQKQSSSTQQQQPNVFALPHYRLLHPHDVLWGRAVLAQNHGGNARLRQFCADVRQSYARANGAVQRARLVDEIVWRVQQLDPPGRFLEYHQEGWCSNVPLDKVRDRVAKLLAKVNKQEAKPAKPPVPAVAAAPAALVAGNSRSSVALAVVDTDKLAQQLTVADPPKTVPEAAENRTVMIRDTSVNDVLMEPPVCHKVREQQPHNRVLYNLCTQACNDYRRAAHSVKHRVVERVWEQMRQLDPPGRFLEHCSAAFYMEAPASRARQKIFQTLREVAAAVAAAAEEEEATRPSAPIEVVETAVNAEAQQSGATTSNAVAVTMTPSESAAATTTASTEPAEVLRPDPPMVVTDTKVKQSSEQPSSSSSSTLGKRKEASKSPMVSSTAHDNTIVLIKNPNSNDVLPFADGYTHSGNRIFRKLCNTSRDAYRRAPHTMKWRVSEKIIQQIQASNPPGRFLNHHVNARGDFVDGVYVEIPHDRALEQVSQELREKGRPEDFGVLDELLVPRQYLMIRDPHEPAGPDRTPDQAASCISGLPHPHDVIIGTFGSLRCVATDWYESGIIVCVCVCVCI